MKNWLKKTLCTKNIIRLTNVFAFIMLIYSANTTCLWVENQPEAPSKMKQFRRF